MVNSNRINPPVDLYLTLAATIVATLLAIFLPTGNALRTVIILPLILILPGYALTAALLPHGIGAAEMLLLTLGLSVSITIVGGIVLNLTVWGLQGTAWAMWLSGTTLLACVIALLRRPQQSTPKPARSLRAYTAWLPIVAATAIAIAICAFGLVLARTGATQQSTRFTQLWLMPDNSKPHAIAIGLRNVEKDTVRYKIQLLVDNLVVKEWSPIALDSGEQWVENLVLAPDWAQAQSVDAVLYRLDKPNVVYRHVWLQHNGAAQ